jgi:F0F1-type ATP synthase assembly protein I
VSFLENDGMPTNTPPDPNNKFSPDSGLGFALRIGTEIISGILVGLVLGYALDHVLDTQPWGLIVMVLLGAASGIMNIFRLLGFWKPPTPPKPPTSRRDV